MTVTAVHLLSAEDKPFQRKNEAKVDETKAGKIDIKSDYWVIHGKRYDLREFVKNHPGGEYILLLGQGRDCTELYESVHALSAREQKSILQKYLVKDDVEPPVPELFEWKEDGFYNVLRQRVREQFKGRNYKASWFIIFKILTLVSLYAYCWTQAVLTGNWWWAVLSGAFTEMVGFNLMHDSSHNAISHRPWVNYLGTLWSSYTFWNHWKWLQHHCYGHHSHTGVYLKDPDVVNASALVRKHPCSPKYPYMQYQGYYYWIAYTLFPNQHVGQIILYQLVDRVRAYKGRLFGMPARSGPDYVERDNLITMSLSFLYHILFPFVMLSFGNALLIIFLHYTLMGISYYAAVAPNHDTEETLKNHPSPDAKVDWGEQQVRTTGNHSIYGGWLDPVIFHLWGGMNYQIEHHLFPAVCHCHYPEISKIVQQTCKDFGLPYNGSSSWAGALYSNSQLYKRMARTPRLRITDM